MNFPVALAFLVLLFALTFFAIHNEQEDPYMDEIFHIPQAKQYCQGNFSHVRYFLHYSILFMMQSFFSY